MPAAVFQSIIPLPLLAHRSNIFTLLPREDWKKSLTAPAPFSGNTVRTDFDVFAKSQYEVCKRLGSRAKDASCWNGPHLPDADSRRYSHRLEAPILRGMCRDSRRYGQLGLPSPARQALQPPGRVLCKTFHASRKARISIRRSTGSCSLPDGEENFCGF